MKPNHLKLIEFFHLKPSLGMLSTEVERTTGLTFTVYFRLTKERRMSFTLVPIIKGNYFSYSTSRLISDYS